MSELLHEVVLIRELRVMFESHATQINTKSASIKHFQELTVDGVYKRLCGEQIINNSYIFGFM
jgi:hypothetical protein